MNRLLGCFVLLLALVNHFHLGSSRVLAEESLVTVELVENPVALRNPLKGWRSQIALHYGWGSKPIDKFGTQPIGTPYESLSKWYVSWNAVEQTEADGIEKLQAYTDQVLADFPRRNMKAIPRIALRSKRGSEIPDDLPPLDNDRACDWYRIPRVQKRIERLIARAGKVWDNDPRIAYVEMGIVSKYGEQWDLGKFPEIEAYLHEAYSKAFKHKPVLVRGCGKFPWTPSRNLAESGPYGFFEDSFGTPMYESELLTMPTIDEGRRWHRSPIGGECQVAAYLEKSRGKAEKGRNDFVVQLPGKRRPMIPNLLTNDRRHDYFLDLIRQSHASFLGSPLGTELGEDHLDRIAEIQKQLGYRLVLQRATFSESTNSGEQLKVSIAVRNDGSSPIYGNWPIVVGLVDVASREAVWSAKLTGLAANDILPGDDYDTGKNAYRKAPKIYTAEQAYTLPVDLPSGEYALAVAVLDSDGGGTRAVRFANENYWQGGWHPLSIVGIGTKPTRQLNSDDYYLEAIDPTLRYQAVK